MATASDEYIFYYEADYIAEGYYEQELYFEGNYLEPGYYEGEQVVAEAVAEIQAQAAVTVLATVFVPAQADLATEATQTITETRIKQLDADFDSLFTPSVTVSAQRAGVALLELDTQFVNTASKFTGYESLLEFFAALNAQSDRTRSLDSDLSAEFTAENDTARLRDIDSSLAVSFDTTVVTTKLKQANSTQNVVATLAADSTKIRPLSADITSVFTLVSTGNAGTLGIQSINLLHEIPNPSEQPFNNTDENFGRNLAINSTSSIVGIPRQRVFVDPFSYSNAGRVLVIDNASGTVTLTIENPEPESGGAFGGQFDFNTLKTTENRFATTGNDKAYVFNLDGTLEFSTTYSDRAIAISDDYFIVGNPIADEDGFTNNGQVRVYAVGTYNTLYTLDNPNDFGTEEGDLFGNNVELHNNKLLVSANEDDEFSPQSQFVSSGVVYLFDLTNGSLQHTFRNPAQDNETALDGFGEGIAINESYIVIGAYQEEVNGTVAGALYVYDSTSLNLLYKINSPVEIAAQFGRYIRIHNDLLIVAHDSVGIRKARVYDLSTGIEISTLSDPDFFNDGENGIFGRSVDITTDYAIVGDYQEDTNDGENSGVVYIYEILRGLTVEGAATLTALAASSAIGTRVQGTTADLIADCETDAQGNRIRLGVANLSSKLETTALVGVIKQSTIDTDSVATQLSAVSKIGQGLITLEAFSQQQASAEATKRVQVSTQTVALIDSDTTVTRGVAADLTVTATQTSTAERARSVSSAFTTAFTATADVVETVQLSAELASEFASTVEAAIFVGNTADLNTAATVTATATRIKQLASDTTLQFEVSAEPIISVDSQAQLTSAATVSATATRIKQTTVLTDSIATQLAAVAKIGDYLVTLESTAQVETAPVVLAENEIPVNSAFSQSVQGTKVRLFSVELESASNSTAAVNVIASGDVDIASTVEFAATAQKQIGAAADIASAMQFESSVRAQREGEIESFATSTVVADAGRTRNSSSSQNTVFALGALGGVQVSAVAVIDSQASVAAELAQLTQLEQLVYTIPREQRTAAVRREQRSYEIPLEHRSYKIRG